MKKTLLSIIYFLACIFSIQAQVLYGTTPRGGNDGGGTINKFIPATNNLTVVKSFESISGVSGENFIQASDGKLYGMTRRRGANDASGIFSFDPSSSTYTKLKDFVGNDGAYPAGGLIQATDGKLYGMTLNGGGSSSGVIFSFDPSASAYTKLKDFDFTNGANPYGSLMQASDGKLYGMTNWGGLGYGVIFSFDLSSSTYTKLKDFDNTNGASPRGSLIQASDGKLYGMTLRGGSNDRGVIFSFDPSASAYTKLQDFDGTNGENPRGSLVQASDGKLYGMAGEGSNGHGVIFSFDPSASTYTKLKDFDGANGGSPSGSLMQASDGKLYGVAGGGSSGVGVIFSFDSPSSTYTKLKDFDGANGGTPLGSLVQATDGKLYGMTVSGGIINFGVIFSFDPSASTYTKLKDGGINETGANISGSLVQATDGKLYGMMRNGGSNGRGVIFSFDPSSSSYTKLKDFDTTNGGIPIESLTLASDGKLYGMTSFAYGRGSGYGSIFSFDPSASIYTKLKDFDLNNTPSGGLIQASDGKLYGSSGGGIFSFDPLSSTYTKLKDGFGAFGSLMQASDGKLYGTAAGGSSGAGVIFSFDPSSSTYTKLYDIRDIDIYTSPIGSLVQASDGKLYGMIVYAGRNGAGEVIFSFDLSTSTYTELKGFNTDGANANGSLMQASDGKLYVTLGAIFSYDLSSSTFTKLQDYDGISAFIEVKDGVYCTAKGVCSSKGFIKNVYACYSFNNTTCCTGYGDYTAKVVNTKAGRLLGFSVTPGYHSSTYQPLVYTRAWIDWNGDGDFTDAGELVYAPFHPVNVKTKFWIRVPAGTGAGKKRMRVAVSADYKMSPCGTIANGEVEDYSINVLAARFAAPDAGPDAFDEAGETFTIYPNPVKQKMIIERSGYDEGKANNAPALMVLTNASGKTLMQHRLANLVQAVDVSRLPSGVYFVTIINGNNKTTNKIIINR